MKTRATITVHAHVAPKSGEGGHVIILTLIVCLLLGLVLLSVISLSTNEGHMTVRSHSWNGAIPVAEAGIEEDFTHLKYNPTNRAANDWKLVPSPDGEYYLKGRTIGDARYEVTISTNYDPTII